ncbi:hypothetical protein ALP64_202527 [Pseudomonas syringae pv. actinidiae]|uniref:Uncharacterized protein n=1 Tax=Pseudomonas syringae pv. actinidiae TaxID=103796 RepID=A0A2V0QH91_PSESF|nr:hypothetical protein ALP64_202527 [Pseudomonas syringae pv. actinidiae]BBI46618.1 hypothetical protein KPSA1B_105388 [Pseudomonas syringae pv. actinidiae]GBH12147.1 hypothetical protein KPSA1_05611 [Pseudomonas syringae pv. actinidiae]
MRLLTRLLSCSLLALGMACAPAMSAEKATPIQFGALTWEAAA